ncbi:putative zinc finger protein 705EP [Ornithodoros turicata]|uniref:putative zinc finger protein 705EP n=1 Tax=Ornithodoros turicata TaxID=34597 RepID=UPI0031395576
MGFAHGDAVTAPPEHHLLTLQSVRSEEPVPKGSLGDAPAVKEEPKDLGDAEGDTEEPFEGPQCSSPCASEGLPEEPPKSKHPFKGGKRRCHFCNYSSNKASHVKRHERSHTGEKRYVCGVCCRGFAEKCTLTKHLRVVHMGERKHACNICGRTFKQKHHLTRHTMSVHP